MDWVPFHHPHISLPVLRRRVVEEFLDLISEFGNEVTSLAIISRWQSSYPSDQTFDRAVARLRRMGIIASRRTYGQNPFLILTEKGETGRPAELRPQKYWNRRWNEIWYVLVYDIPESSRKYRNSLRMILRKLRMGSLQGSVWVSPNDIRPEFDDLDTAAGVGIYAFLFESRTVLGQCDTDIVQNAWDFEAIGQLQSAYISVFQENLTRLSENEIPNEEILDLARYELATYLSVMRPDPLLPRALWPSGYLGEETFNAHRDFVKAARSKLRRGSNVQQWVLGRAG